MTFNSATGAAQPAIGGTSKKKISNRNQRNQKIIETFSSLQFIEIVKELGVNLFLIFINHNERSFNRSRLRRLRLRGLFLAVPA